MTGLILKARIACMIRVSITELKNKLSSYLRLVREGEIVEIMDRSVPIARIESIKSTSSDDAVRDRLVRDGIVAPARVKPKRALLETPPVPCQGDAVRALIEERGDR